jgi:hypothetical protein
LPGYKYGQSGFCYTYTPGNESARKKAKQKAHIQGAAIAANTGEVVKEEFDAAAFIEKYNQCHGPAGKFCSGGKSGGGGGSKQDAPGARLLLKPFVGQTVTMTATVDAHGFAKGSNVPTACINKINVKLPNGKQASVDHMWVRDPPATIANAKPGTKLNLTGTVKPYTKAKGRDYTVKDFTSVEVRKSAVDADEIITKYNQCHGPGGKFCSSGRGGGGVATEQAGGVQSLEDALAGKPIEVPEERDFMDPNPSAESYKGRTIKYVDDQAGVPSDIKKDVNKQVDDIATNAKLQNLKDIEYKQLDQNVLMQCEGSWDTRGGKVIGKEVLAIDPTNMEFAKQKYFEDKGRIAAGYQPWLANGHASSPEEAYKAVIVHEIGHAKMMEHVLKRPETEWIDAHNPMYGDKKWKDTVDGAIKSGWGGPSTYGKKNYAETFAESLSLLTMKPSTGAKDVDKYVLEVLAE